MRTSRLLPLLIPALFCIACGSGDSPAGGASGAGGGAGAGTGASGGASGTGPGGAGAAGASGTGAAGASGTGAGGGEPDNPYVLPPADIKPSEVSFDVAWKPGTVQVPLGAALASLETPTPTDGVFRFKAPYPPLVEGIEGGAHLLLEEIGLYRVEFTDMIDGVLLVYVSHGNLQEAAGSAKLSFDVNLAESQGFPSLNQPLAPTPGGWMPQTPGPVTHEFSEGPYKLKVTAQKVGTDLQLAFEGGRDPDANGAVLKFSATATVRNLRAVGNYTYAPGQALPLGSIGARAAVVGRIKYSLSTLTGAAKWKVPLKFTLPFALGPIPMFISISPSVEVQTSVSVKGDGSEGTAYFSWAGDAGFNLSQTGPQPAGTSTALAQIGPVSVASTVTCGVGMVGEVKFDVGTGVVLPPLPGYFGPTGQYTGPLLSDIGSHASVFAKVKAEVVGNLDVDVSKPSPSPYCLTGSANLGAYVGGELQLFGITLTEELQVKGYTNPFQPKGTGCPTP